MGDSYHRGKRNYGSGFDMMELIDRLEAALVAKHEEVEKWKRAFAEQSRKLQAVLHIPSVREELAALRENTDD
jgi:hypothetical protein